MDSTAFVGAAAPLRVAAAARPTICMAADDKPVVSRRAALAGAAAAAVAAVAASLPALAETEYANVPFLGGSDIIDINNANVRAYAKYPGMYPTVAGLLATNGPYEKVEDVFKIPGLTDRQITTLKKYQDKLVALTPTPEYVRFFLACAVLAEGALSAVSRDVLAVPGWRGCCCIFLCSCVFSPRGCVLTWNVCALIPCLPLMHFLRLCLAPRPVPPVTLPSIVSLWLSQELDKVNNGLYR